MRLPEATLSRMNQFLTTGFGWAVPAHNSQRAYRNHIKHFEEFLFSEHKTIFALTTQDVEAYVAHVQTFLRPNSAYGRVAAIKSYLSWAQRNDKISHIPKIKSLKYTPIARTNVTESEIQQLLDKIPNSTLGYVRDAAMIALMAYRGFSTQEAVDLNVNDMDFMNNRIRNRKQWHPMGKAYEYLLQYAQEKWGHCLTLGAIQKEDDPFFLNKFRKRISSRSLRRHFGLYLEAANLKGKFSTRDLYASRDKKTARVPKLVAG